jgi:hypothetical protein
MEILAERIMGMAPPERGMYVDLQCYSWLGQYMLGLSALGRGEWRRAMGCLRGIFRSLPEDEAKTAGEAIAICRKELGE